MIDYHEHRAAPVAVGVGLGGVGAHSVSGTETVIVPSWRRLARRLTCAVGGEQPRLSGEAQHALVAGSNAFAAQPGPQLAVALADERRL